MSEQAYTSIHYFTTHRRHENQLSMGERFKIAWHEFKEDFSKTYQAMLDNSADMVITKLGL